MMLQPIILAAGKGTRMKAPVPKGLVEVAGKPMIRHILDAIEASGVCERPIIVIGHEGEQIKKFLGGSYAFVEQKELNGTASAVEVALPLVATEAAVVLYVDHPFIKPETIRRMAEAVECEKPSVVQTTTRVKDYKDWRAALWAFARIIRTPDGGLKKIVEYKNASEEEKNILEVNPGPVCYETAWLKAVLPLVKADSVSGERYLTELISVATSDKKRIVLMEMSPEESLGVNSLEDAAHAESVKIL
jgi:bifunctional UDP-N-acetylglucosamine pyrophosphorylase/glucosamine-1-phosphate N-acetyltransferase